MHDCFNKQIGNIKAYLPYVIIIIECKCDEVYSYGFINVNQMNMVWCMKIIILKSIVMLITN